MLIKFGTPTNFEQGIIVELVGVMCDAIVLVIVYNWLSSLGEKKRKIESLTNELEDYKLWTEDEAAYRVRGIVRRLKNLGVEEIDFEDLHVGKLDSETLMQIMTSEFDVATFDGAVLDNQYVSNVCVEYKSFNGAQFSDCGFYNSSGLNSCTFENASFYDVELKNGSYEDMLFSESDLHRVNFKGSFLKNTLFLKTSIRHCNFSHADLRGTSFNGSHLFETVFLDAIVDSIDWIDEVSLQVASGSERIRNLYTVHNEHDKMQNKFFWKVKSINPIVPAPPEALR